MIVRFNRWYNAVLTALLSMLGYGCDESSLDMYGTPVTEYGTPYAEYRVKGQVTDESGVPINGIKTSAKNIVISSISGEHGFGLDSVQTDASGQFAVSFRCSPRNSETKLIVEDIDGAANGGEFLSDTLDVEFDKAVQTTKGDGWYEGSFEITQDVKMKKKP
ncbi:MAG: radical SAM-associated putative lipoprotein [Prevotella sp.]|nr:radical SAM-associated putative lipoprotein [Prevotella sp.]